MATQLRKDLWAIKRELRADLADWPHITCPTCLRGHLTPDADTMVAEEDARSIQWRSLEDWQPEFVQGSFHMILRCSKRSCEIVRLVGTTSLYRDGASEFEDQWVEALHPIMFLPAVPLMESRLLCPDSVGVLIDAAAQIAWLDPSSAVNRLRAAVEAIMDEQSVPSTNSASSRTTLHQRIESWKRQNPQLAEAADGLMAIKWVGNVGTHGAALEFGDVVDLVEIIDDVVRSIYDTSRARLAQKIAEINQRRGEPL